ncbi:hypothetical protein [Deinococcus navajonensis]|uniref:Uncharacterized protein n=1 Tax=Deinococcus navajonensis TaxID=309884 RepID=A0ABV8XJG5_9DEIO
MGAEDKSFFNFDDLPALFTPAEEQPPRVTFERLSRLLKPLPANECHLILEQFTAALLEGHIRAVPFLGRTFTKTVIDGAGHKTQHVIQDELIEVDKTFLEWIKRLRKAARYQVLVHVGDIGTTEERLASGEDDFQALLQARLLRLKAEQPRKRSRA